jgi:hypothetical protein
MEIALSDLWTAAGVLLGFQVTAFAWRVSHEAEVADRGDVSWIPPADYLNLSAMVVTAIGCFVLPSIGMVSVLFAAKVLGLGVVLLVGHSFCLAAHYELFNRRTKRSYRYFPLQERVAFATVTSLSLVYIYAAFFSA